MLRYTINSIRIRRVRNNTCWYINAYTNKDTHISTIILFSHASFVIGKKPAELFQASALFIPSKIITPKVYIYKYIYPYSDTHTHIHTHRSWKLEISLQSTFDEIHSKFFFFAKTLSRRSFLHLLFSIYVYRIVYVFARAGM